MAASGTLVIRFIGDLKEFERATAALGAKLTKMGAGLTKTVTLPLVGLGVAAVKSFADFQTELAKTRGLVGVSEKQIKTFSAAILKEGPKWGKAPQELAEALFFVTSAGFRGKEAMSVLAASAKASTAGLGETKVVADLVTSAVNAYGIKNLSAAQATDVLTNAVKLGKLQADTLSESMGRVLPIASNMGVSFDQVGAAMAGMSKTGTNAHEAATQLRGILFSLLKPSAKAEATLKGMGTSAGELRGQLKDKGLLSVLQTLQEKFKGNDDAAAKVFGNVRALSGVMDLMGGNVKDNIRIFGEMQHSAGLTDEAFQAVAETAQFKFDKAMGQIKSSLIIIGGTLAPMVAKAVGKLGDLIERGGKAWANMSPEMKKVVIVAAGIAAAVGPVLLIVGKLLTMLSLFANPVGIAVLAVTALAGALAAGGHSFDEVRAAVMKAVNAILPTIRSLGRAFMDRGRPRVPRSVGDHPEAAGPRHRGSAADPDAGREVHHPGPRPGRHRCHQGRDPVP